MLSKDKLIINSNNKNIIFMHSEYFLKKVIKAMIHFPKVQNVFVIFFLLFWFWNNFSDIMKVTWAEKNNITILSNPDG